LMLTITDMLVKIVKKGVDYADMLVGIVRR
jgi:hypothetical protein